MAVYLRALAYFRRDLALVALLLALIAASTAVGLLMAWPMAILVDSVLAAPASNDWIHRLFLSVLPAGRTGQIIGLGAAGMLLKFLQDLLSMLQTLVTNHINYQGLVRVRCDLFRRLQSLHLSYHRSQPQGDAIYRLSSDTFGLQTILQVLIQTAVAAVTLIVMTLVLMSRNVGLTLMAFSIAPPLALLNVIFGRRLKQRSLECRERDAQFTTVVQRSMACIGLVQAFGREGAELGRFTRSVRGTIAAWWRLNRQQMLYNLLVGTVFGAGGAVIFVYGGWLVSNERLSIGDLMIFTAYLGMLWGPLCSLTGFAANVQGGVAGAQRVFEVLDRAPAIADVPGAAALELRPRTLELERLDFAYPASEQDTGLAVRGKPVLRGISAKIRPGQMVAFVGTSGAGKSTLLNLFPRFFDPTAGKVMLDGLDMRKIRVSDVRRHVALVLQEPVILPTTIAENIAYGRPSASAMEIQQAAALAGAAEFIEAMPDGYDTIVQENGSNLSGGQRQRISIARALLTQAPFVVLDEPTSALDAHHEAVVIEALKKLKGQRTIILVSHRLSSVAACDQIFVLEGGRIVERGTHEQLLDQRGAYFEMARRQMMLEPQDLSVSCAA